MTTQEKTQMQIQDMDSVQRARLMFDFVRYEDLKFIERSQIIRERYGVSARHATDILVDIKEWEIYYQQIGTVFDTVKENKSFEIKWDEDTTEAVHRLGLKQYHTKDRLVEMSNPERIALLFDSVLIRDDGSYMEKTWGKAHKSHVKFLLDIPEWKGVRDMLKEAIEYAMNIE